MATRIKKEVRAEASRTEIRRDPIAPDAVAWERRSARLVGPWHAPVLCPADVSRTSIVLFSCTQPDAAKGLAARSAGSALGGAS